MSTIYGPKSSPFGKNEALEQLATQLEKGEVPANLATAKEAIAIVESDGRVTTEESQALDRVWKAALEAKPGVNGASLFGRDLLLNFAHGARTRLFATQANRSVDPMSQLISMWSWGMIPAKPSYVSTTQNPLGGTKASVSASAFEKTLDDHAGKWKLIRFVEKNFPSAIADPGHSHQAPKLHADVEAAYQSMRKDVLAGRVDEHDPLAPMKAFLAENY